MSGVEDLAECPLCMEPFEIDDLSFFPCTCGYQICRFCWHRIRMNENGLCPACRKSYPEDPAEFKPLTDDEVQRIKKDRRLKESQRKQKAAECRKHLTNIRVVQKNLVFVVGLSPRLCDAEILRRHEYFGKFGKIHKVVINQSTSYVGSQGPSASAYVTYFRPEDALAAIRTVNNLQIDGRTLKASLGTTKYCSHFLKNTQCLKPECMYLHDYGDEAASFSKEEIQQGKHLVYEQKLHEQFGNLPSAPSNSPDPTQKLQQSRTKDRSPPGSGQLSPTGSSTNPSPDDVSDLSPVENSTFLNHCSRPVDNGVNSTMQQQQQQQQPPMPMPPPLYVQQLPFMNHIRAGMNNNHMSLFSDPIFHSARFANHSTSTEDRPVLSGEMRLPANSENSSTELLTNGMSSVHSVSENNEISSQDDDLGFDPWDVSARALADLIEKEKVLTSRPTASQSHSTVPPVNHHYHGYHSRLKFMPPGFTHNGFPPQLVGMRHPGFVPHMAAMQQQQYQQRSRMLGLMQSVSGQPSSNGQPQSQSPSSPTAQRMPFQPVNSTTGNLFRNTATSSAPALDSSLYSRPPQTNDAYIWQDWREGLKAMLPNVNISFSAQPQNSAVTGTNTNEHLVNQPPNGFVNSQHGSHLGMNPFSNSPDKNWSSRSIPDLSWDPAIVNSGNVTSVDGVNEEAPPHWMASLHNLTEDNGTVGNTLGFSQHNSPVQSSSWVPLQPMSHRLLPPGFGQSPSSPSRQNLSTADNTVLGDHQMSA